MSNLQNNAPASAPRKRSGLGWFCGGLGLAIAIVLLLCCGSVASVIGYGYYKVHQVTSFYTSTETPAPAVQYSGETLPQDKIDAAWNRCVDAHQQVVAGKPATVTLTDVEWMNLVQEWLKNNPQQKLGGLNLKTRAGGITGQLSVQDPLHPGQWLNLDIDADLAITGDQLTFQINALKNLKGEDAPPILHAAIDAIFRAGFIEGFDQLEGNHPQTQQAKDMVAIQPTSPMYGLKTLTFAPGSVTAEIDPEKVKAHNRAVGQPDDAPLFSPHK
ncbi:MAG: hypothetical protein ACREJ2_02625 [Planctomycetota bacterium]